MSLYIQTNHELQLLLREKDAQLTECMAILKELEWSGRNDYLDDRYCPSCYWVPVELGGRGHAPDCRLAAQLAAPLAAFP